MTTQRMLRLRREIALLKAERKALETEVILAVDRHRPSDMEPLFQREIGQ